MRAKRLYRVVGIKDGNTYTRNYQSLAAAKICRSRWLEVWTEEDAPGLYFVRPMDTCEIYPSDPITWPDEATS